MFNAIPISLSPLVSCTPVLGAGPQNKTAVDGGKVSLICDLNNDNDHMIFWILFDWTKMSPIYH